MEKSQKSIIGAELTKNFQISHVYFLRGVIKGSERKTRTDAYSTVIVKQAN